MTGSSLEESIVLDATPECMFDTVANVRRAGEWSPECFRVVARRRPQAVGDRFVGSGRTPQRTPTAVFLVGQPDAGKSRVSDMVAEVNEGCW